MIKRSSLSKKIISYVSISVFIFLVAELYWNYWNLRQDLYAHMETRAIALADEIGYAFEALAIMHKDDFSMRRIVEQTATIFEVKDVGITNRDGYYTFHNQRDRIGERIDNPLVAKVIESERRQITYGNNEFIIIQPLHGEEYSKEHLSDVIGTIIIRMDLTTINSQLSDKFLASSLAKIIFIILFSVGMLVIMVRLIIKPIKSLSAATKQLSDGNWNVNVKLLTSDEIGELADSFNIMIRSLEERKERLQVQKGKLKKVNSLLNLEIGERKQAEEKLEATVAELRDTRDQLVRREKLAVLGQLAGGVAHELRNPLAVMNNAIYYLTSINTDADETTREYLEMISSEIGNAEAIVSDLLDFSRTRSSVRKQVTAAELIARVLEKHPPPEKVKVTTAIPPELPPVFVDPRQIGQVLENLVANACQAMAEGGHLTISAQAEKQKVTLFITDTGCGISKENMEKIFEPLFTTRARGIGLGLTVSRNLVEQNSGTIEVQSPSTALGIGEAGKGSTFTVKLPTK